MSVLPAELIPVELWSDSVLRLPTTAAECYGHELTALGLLTQAKAGTDKKSIHGGCGAAETLEHFTYRFSVSAGRLEFSALAPDSGLALVSDALLSSFADGHVTLLDIPCGCGSTAIALLATLNTLRSKGSLPTLPLTVTVMGGDCSQKAIEIYDSMMTRIKPLVASTGIEINWFVEVWDATRADSTASLIDKWFMASAGAGEYVVCIANFSGALTHAGNFEAFSPNLEQILGRLHDKKSTLVWLEPSGATVKEKLLPRIVDFLKKRIAWFFPHSGSSEFMSSNYKMTDPVNGKIFDSGVEVQRFVRK